VKSGQLGQSKRPSLLSVSTLFFLKNIIHLMLYCCVLYDYFLTGKKKIMEYKGGEKEKFVG